MEPCYNSTPDCPRIISRTKWKLYEDVTINSKGFALQPYFASRIDSITGRTLHRALVDLGSWRQNTSYVTDMKAYIALSRVRAAHDSMLTDILPPTIFS
eukprot:1639933-Karenia_brevis.AAC.1